MQHSHAQILLWEPIKVDHCVVMDRKRHSQHPRAFVISFS
jgi:hypothetical protein